LIENLKKASCLISAGRRTVLESSLLLLQNTQHSQLKDEATPVAQLEHHFLKALDEDEVDNSSE